jgi:hypothetical protein
MAQTNAGWEILQVLGVSAPYDDIIREERFGERWDDT